MPEPTSIPPTPRTNISSQNSAQNTVPQIQKNLNALEQPQQRSGGGGAHCNGVLKDFFGKHQNDPNAALLEAYQKGNSEQRQSALEVVALNFVSGDANVALEMAQYFSAQGAQGLIAEACAKADGFTRALDSARAGDVTGAISFFQGASAVFTKDFITKLAEETKDNPALIPQTIMLLEEISRANELAAHVVAWQLLKLLNENTKETIASLQDSIVAKWGNQQMVQNFLAKRAEVITNLTGDGGSNAGSSYSVVIQNNGEKQYLEKTNTSDSKSSASTSIFANLDLARIMREKLKSSTRTARTDWGQSEEEKLEAQKTRAKELKTEKNSAEKPGESKKSSKQAKFSKPAKFAKEKKSKVQKKTNEELMQEGKNKSKKEKESIRSGRAAKSALMRGAELSNFKKLREKLRALRANLAKAKSSPSIKPSSAAKAKPKEKEKHKLPQAKNNPLKRIAKLFPQSQANSKQNSKRKSAQAESKAQNKSLKTFAKGLSKKEKQELKKILARKDSKAILRWLLGFSPEAKKKTGARKTGRIFGLLKKLLRKN